MSEPLLPVLEEEERKLLTELRSYPAFQRLELVQALIRAYRAPSVSGSFHGASASALAGNLPSLNPVVTVAAHRERRPRQSSTAAQVVKVAEEFLVKLGRRAPSSEIAEEVRRHGIELRGAKPTGVVSSYLSSSDLFDNVKGEGYGLTKWRQAVEERSAEGGQQLNLNPDIERTNYKSEAANPAREIAA
jgi:hypothetical protein